MASPRRRQRCLCRLQRRLRQIVSAGFPIPCGPSSHAARRRHQLTRRLPRQQDDNRPHHLLGRLHLLSPRSGLSEQTDRIPDPRCTSPLPPSSLLPPQHQLLHPSSPLHPQLTPIQTLFALNLLFNFIMWSLFTSALTRSPSTTRVSIVNTSANFVLTAVLGLLIFAESLPPLWWLGAALLVVGNVVIGRRDQEEAVVTAGDVESLPGSEEDGKERDGEDVVLLGEEFELEDDMKGGVDVDDPVEGPSLSYR